MTNLCSNWAWSISAGVVELLVFVESTWGIEISDEDITAERIGSLNKLAALVQEYVARKG